MQYVWRSIAAIAGLFVSVAILLAAVYFAPQIGIGLSQSVGVASLAIAAVVAILLVYPTAAIIRGATENIPVITPRVNSSHYRLDIEGMRALAVSAVVVNHF